jgi:hypothetical protein
LAFANIEDTRLISSIVIGELERKLGIASASTGFGVGL